jgi:predicted ATPase
MGEFTSTAALVGAVRDFLAAVAAQQPLVLVFDDLQWADPASLDLLRFIARTLAAAPIMSVVTYRTEEVTRQHPLHALIPLLVREASAVRLDPQRLSDDDVRALVIALYQLPQREATRLVTHLQPHAEGNAFYLSELLRSLEDDRIVRQDEQGWVVGDLSPMPIPLLLRQVIERRLARLGDDAQPLLAVAAVIGHELPRTLWAAVAGTDEATLLTILSRSAAVSLIDETPDGTGARFAHALVRETVYVGIRPSQRRALHRMVADVLVAGSDHPDPDAVASHFQRAGDTRAAAWLVRAGEHAQRAYAWQTAAARYEAALALMTEQGSATTERGWMLYRLAMQRRFADTTQAIAHLDAALRLAADAEDSMLAAHALCAQGHLRCILGDYQQGLSE